jgi:hypothetical protein
MATFGAFRGHIPNTPISIDNFTGSKESRLFFLSHIHTGLRFEFPPLRLALAVSNVGFALNIRPPSGIFGLFSRRPGFLPKLVEKATPTAIHWRSEFAHCAGLITTT